jgi:hypothetical protein
MPAAEEAFLAEWNRMTGPVIAALRAVQVAAPEIGRVTAALKRLDGVVLGEEERRQTEMLRAACAILGRALVDMAQLGAVMERTGGGGDRRPGG